MWFGVNGGWSKCVSVTVVDEKADIGKVSNTKLQVKCVTAIENGDGRC